MMAKVTGIGGVFFKAQDPEALRRWYRDRLGVAVQEWGGAVFFFNRRDREGIGYTVWNSFSADTNYFASGWSRLFGKVSSVRDCGRPPFVRSCR